MIGNAARSRNAGRRDRTHRLTPRLEGLEGRLLMYAATGAAWTYGSRITYSFMPDGTSIGGTPSSLFQRLNTNFATQGWQLQFQNAAAVWEQVANINLVQVSDNGAPAGSSGYQQDDPNFGDIRIGGYSQGSSTLASSVLPPPINGGTAAGNIFMNTDVAWRINNGNFDLETVAIHEIGHTLGLGHSAITTADMYAYYNTIKQSLSTDDIAGIQSIYGARQPDTFAQAGNTTAATASDLTPYINVWQQAIVPGLNATANGDYHYFKVTIPATTNGTLTVVEQTSNLSQLSPMFFILDANQNYVISVSAPNTYGTFIGASVPNVVPGQVYYIRTQPANSGPTGAGSYGLFVNLGPNALSPMAPPNTQVASQPDRGGGSISLSASQHRSLEAPLDAGDPIQIGSLQVRGDALRITAVHPQPIRRPPHFGHHRGPHPDSRPSLARRQEPRTR